jgi:hypothetical protein
MVSDSISQGAIEPALQQQVNQLAAGERGGREGGGQRSLSGCSALSKAFARASHTVVFTNKGRSPSSRVRLRSRLSVQSGSPTSFTASTPSVGEIDGVP